jgi:hypothetical protein
VRVDRNSLLWLGVVTNDFFLGIKIAKKQFFIDNNWPVGDNMQQGEANNTNKSGVKK